MTNLRLLEYRANKPCKPKNVINIDSKNLMSEEMMKKIIMELEKSERTWRI